MTGSNDKCLYGLHLASWFDHPRDLLHMINHFRNQMPRPLVGIGHSMGGNNLWALIHCVPTGSADADYD